MPNGVLCSVSNCSYWSQGNRCAAQEIAIEVDSHASNHWDEEFAEEFALHQDHAENSSTTCCLTFRPKEED